MKRRISYVLRAAFGAALVTVSASGAALAQSPTPVAPTPTSSPTPTPTPTPRYELDADAGKVSAVGEMPGSSGLGNAIVRLSGGFVYDGPLDFDTTTITIRSLLGETGGAGELLKGVHGTSILPTVLFRRSGNDRNVVFMSPGSTRPTIRVGVRRKADAVYLFDVKISRASVPADPTLCTGTPQTTQLDAVLVLDDGVNPEITVAGAVDWICELGENKLRVPTESETPPPSGNAEPKASIRTNLLTRETGQPSLVLLDGSNSSDSDGSLVLWTFRVATKAGTLVYGPAAVATPFVTTTLPPGDYVASLVVTDDKAAVSKTATRSFSIK